MNTLNKLKRAINIIDAENKLMIEIRKSPLFKASSDEQIKQFIRDNYNEIMSIKASKP